ncbi:MAG: GIY-YIG nuclease family protein [Fusobacteriaceae bacterium]|nr:GIY-YIG nuclease family protein [Fusobacteriaceae bacterium]MBP9510586.1 GIY-YIG nuclease family protein [Fusobacteriaceae bacterium]
MESNLWYVYMLRCEDNSIYTGIAKNYEKRFKEHLDGVGAKYTKSRKPVKIEKIFQCFTRSEASKLEYKIKKLTKIKKEKLIFE